MDDIKKVLGSIDHTTGNKVRNENTYARVIYMFSDKLKIIIASGNPRGKEYIRIDFEQEYH